MKIGIIGLGVVGGTLRDWFVKHTDHELKLLDPMKGHDDSLEGCDAAFIAIPVNATAEGQDTFDLENMVDYCRHRRIQHVFIRSTVLPGTAARLGCWSAPEFLTERRAAQDMENLPVLIGRPRAVEHDRALDILEAIFPKKDLLLAFDTEAELAKYAHNCFGALKVTYFNIIHDLCHHLGVSYARVMGGVGLTGFIEPEHTAVPGPDGKKGFGGKCFPPNVASFRGFLESRGKKEAAALFSIVRSLNTEFRGRE